MYCAFARIPYSVLVSLAAYETLQLPGIALSLDHVAYFGMPHLLSSLHL